MKLRNGLSLVCGCPSDPDGDPVAQLCASVGEKTNKSLTNKWSKPVIPCSSTSVTVRLAYRLWSDAEAAARGRR